jgi:hypothetical protein
MYVRVSLYTCEYVSDRVVSHTSASNSFVPKNKKEQFLRERLKKYYNLSYIFVSHFKQGNVCKFVSSCLCGCSDFHIIKKNDTYKK